MSDEARKPEDLLKSGRILVAIAAVMLPVAAVLYSSRLEPGSLLERLRRGVTTSGLIALAVGLLQLYEGRRARRR